MSLYLILQEDIAGRKKERKKPKKSDEWHTLINRILNMVF